MTNVFAIPVFFICFRETLETSIIVSVLLAFLKQTLHSDQNQDPTLYKKLKGQVWYGTALGLFICIAIGAGLIGAFYGLGNDLFGSTESIWEGVFGLLAAIIITLMGAALLRISKIQEKWRVKLTKALEAQKGTDEKSSGKLKTFAKKYAMFILPFITVLREGLEAVVFIGGVGLSLPATSFPLAVILGLAAGVLVGYLIYLGGTSASLQICLIGSTCFLYLVAAGIFSKAVWFFEADAWNKVVGGEAAEMGSGPGSYDYRQSVWHVNCCSPMLDGGGGWGVFNSLFGWTNSATYGSVISYNLYWITLIIVFMTMWYNEKYGHWPFLKASTKSSNSSEDPSIVMAPKAQDV